MPGLTGGCACGAIRYECSAPPLFAVNCHCRDCQRESGSAYGAILGVPGNAFTVTRGTPTTYTVTADSGRPTTRAFCGDCGTPLYGVPGSAAGAMATIRAASLDDPGLFRPTQDIYTSSAQPWDHMDPALPKARKLPGVPG